MNAFDEAWAIVKEFYIENPDLPTVDFVEGGFKKKPQRLGFHAPAPLKDKQGRIPEEPFALWQTRLGNEFLSPNFGYPISIPPAYQEPSVQPGGGAQAHGYYQRGGGYPQAQVGGAAPGSFIGARVGPETTDSPESIQQLADILAHEHTHGLINPEITQWMNERYGPSDPAHIPREYSEEDTAKIEAARAAGEWWPQTGYEHINQAEMDEEASRAAAADQARTYAHEYGAHQADQSSQAGVNERLQNRPDTSDYWNQLQGQGQ